MPRRQRPLAARLWSRAERNETTGCWEWQGPKTNGYGVLSREGRRGSSQIRAHRAAYELTNGPIPEGLHIDHLCRNRACINPDHLEPVPQHVNNQRAGDARTHCPYGHELPPPREPGQTRRKQCAKCQSDHARRRHAAKKAERRNAK